MTPDKKKKLPIYKMVIDPNAEDQSGVDYIALVDDPAILRDWMKFNTMAEPPKFKFQTTNTEKKIISGFLMLADLPIYRRDPQMITDENPNGEFYVTFDAPTIESIRTKFCEKGYYHNINMMHDPAAKVEGVFLIDSFLIGGDLKLQTPEGFDPAPEGSWFASFKVNNDAVWDEFIKTGLFRGFSVEGLFGMKYEDTAPQKEIEKLVDIIANSFKGFDIQAV